MKQEQQVDTDIKFLMRVSLLGVAQGFCEKMVDDMITSVRNSSLNHKGKKRELQKLVSDVFVVECKNVVKYSNKLLHSTNKYVNDDDLKLIWLVVDRFLEQHILENTFITMSNTFLGIFSDLPKFGGDDFDCLMKSLTKVNSEITKEFYEKKKEDYAKANVDDPDFLFDIFERTEMDKAKAASDKFFSIFKSRYSFERYANAYKKRLKGDKLLTFKNIM